MSGSPILLVGTYDSKAAPYGALAESVARFGGLPRTMDVGVFGSEVPVDVPAMAVVEAAGRTHEEVRTLDRAEAVEVMIEGAERLLDGIVEAGEIGALVMMGGSNAASIFMRLSARVPTGIPKIFMGTFVSGDTRNLVGASDVVLLYPVVDIEGSNSVLDRMIDRLARTAVALTPALGQGSDAARPTRIAISMYGVTTPCAQAIARSFEAEGIEALTFHANGTGGRSIEHFAAAGMIDGLADITIAELANEVLGGGFPAGPDRMTTAARRGIPQVIVPGALDMIAFGPPEDVPETFRGHRMHRHNALVTLVRTTPEECARVGSVLARRLDAPGARTVLCLPLGGTSMLDIDGGPFRDEGALLAFRDAFAAAADAAIEIVEHEGNINDPAFAGLVATRLRDAMAG